MFSFYLYGLWGLVLCVVYCLLVLVIVLFGISFYWSSIGSWCSVVVLLLFMVLVLGLVMVVIGDSWLLEVMLLLVLFIYGLVVNIVFLCVSVGMLL